MIFSNSFYTCMVNREQSAIAAEPGWDAIKHDFVPVKRYDAIEELAKIIFTQSPDHMRMSYAIAKSFVMDTYIGKACFNSLTGGWPGNLLCEYYLTRLRSPETLTGEKLMYYGKFQSKLYQIHQFNVTEVAGDLVLAGVNGDIIDTQPISSGNSTSLALNSELRVLIPNGRVPLSFQWASYESIEGFSVEEMGPTLSAMAGTVKSLPTCFSSILTEQLCTDLADGDYLQRFVAGAALVAGHTAQLAGIALED